MRDPRSLYEMNPDVSVPPGLPLVAGLTGFADAGGAVAQTTEYLRSTLDTTVVATFDVDELLDYRARRPIILFEGDHLTEYTPPRLALDLARDELGQPFLLLTGFEPDFQWEQFTTAVLELVDQFEVSSTTWINAIPMPVPHTRPISVTVSGNRQELIERCRCGGRPRRCRRMCCICSSSGCMSSIDRPPASCCSFRTT